jgi:hypothetical protein
MISSWIGDQEGNPMAKRKPAKAYVVQRIDWRFVDRAEPLERSEWAGIPLKVFTDRDEAEAHCRKLQRKERKAVVNPFAYGRSFPALDDFTSTPTDEFITWLEQQGVRPPEGQLERWRQWESGPQAVGGFDQDSFDCWMMWWFNSAKTWDSNLLNRVWDRLDKVRLFEVVEVEQG